MQRRALDQDRHEARQLASLDLRQARRARREGDLREIVAGGADHPRYDGEGDVATRVTTLTSACPSRPRTEKLGSSRSLDRQTDLDVPGRSA